ncbi:MAG: dihydrolipoamide acetyltransferase family protein [Candidatus Latescibacterota bacterium]|nr:dihydrolipoamide acetyltransferase family protein [Candidatus Latescibacterota bacterium]
MATNVVMPKLGLTMESGVIGSWLVGEGDHVSKGQPLLEVITDKVTMEVEAQEDGFIRKIIYPEGSEIKVSKRIAIIGGKDEKIDEKIEVDDEKLKDPAEMASDLLVETPSETTKIGFKRKLVSPKARKIAAKHDVDLSLINGSGANGRVVSSDIDAYLTGIDGTSTYKMATTKDDLTPTDKVCRSGERVDLLPVEKIVSQRLTESYQETPHIQLSVEVSAIWLEQLRNGYKLEGKGISYNSLIVRGIALALEEFPRVNSHYCKGGFIPQERVNIGLAVAAESGLIVPVIKNVNELSIEDLSGEANRLIDKARHGRLSTDDCVGGGFTISNLGMMGISQFTAIINPPQVAIMAVGAIQKKVVAVGDDGFAIRPLLTLTLGADHRVLDGAISGRFLSRIKEILETPSLLA